MAENEELKHHAKATQKAINKLGKTLVATLHNVKDKIKKKDFDQSWDKIYNFMQVKWQSVKERLDKNVDNVNKEVKTDGATSTLKKWKEDEVEIVEPRANKHSRWSYQSMDGNEAMSVKNSSKWFFERAKSRKENRQESERGDWIFERAKDRKRFHDLGQADWHSKRLYNKVCAEDEVKHGQDLPDCEDLGELNSAEMNRVQFKKSNVKDDKVISQDEEESGYESESTIPFANYLSPASSFSDDDAFFFLGQHPDWLTKHARYAFKDDDDDDEDDDDDDDELIRPVHGYHHQREASNYHKKFYREKPYRGREQNQRSFNKAKRSHYHHSHHYREGRDNGHKRGHHNRHHSYSYKRGY